MERSSGTSVKIPVSHPPNFSDKLLTAATIRHFLAVRPSFRDYWLQMQPTLHADGLPAAMDPTLR
jgi:hypothetical protein